MNMRIERKKERECNSRKIVGYSQDRNGGVQKERKRQIDIDHKRHKCNEHEDDAVVLFVPRQTSSVRLRGI